MKRNLQLLTAAIILLLSTTNLKAQDANGDGYHDGDVAVLNKILTDNAGNTLGWSGTDYVSWSGVTWDYSNPRRIKNLSVKSRNLSKLDLSSCTALKALYCNENKLISLDVSNCDALEELWCNSNKLTSLNVSSCTALLSLMCENNLLTTLDVSNCNALGELIASSNQLTSLNVNGCIALNTLWFHTNQVTSIDLSSCTYLKSFSCSGNQLTSLDLTSCTTIEEVSCKENQLTSLNVSDLADLISLDCRINPLTTLNISGCKALTYLCCIQNSLPYSQLAAGLNLSNFRYKPQNKVFREVASSVGTEIDFSTEEVIGGENTIFVWYKDGFVIDGASSSKYTPTSRGVYHCEMINTKFEGLIIVTNNIIVNNEAPTNLTLSNNVVAEDAPVGTEVGVLSATDVDANDVLTYTIADNENFKVEGDKLVTKSTFDYETKSEYKVMATATDKRDLKVEKEFTITITVKNEAPTNITLSNNVVAEDATVGTEVGVLSATDVDVNDVLAYTIADNENFKVEGDKLVTKSTFDYETKSEYKVVATATDKGGLKVEKEFTITITDRNEAPTNLTLSNNVVAEDAPVGTEVGVLSVTDVDANDVLAYTIADNENFKVEGDKLVTKSTFDYEAKPEYKVMAIATDKGGLKVEKEFTITITKVKTTAIDKAVNANVKLYPNPAVTTITIETSVLISRVDIVNISGTVVSSQIVNATNTNVDVSNLQSGIYNIKGYTSEGVITRKFVKR